MITLFVSASLYYTYIHEVSLQVYSVGHFIFRLNLSFKPKLKPKFGLNPKLIWTIQFKTERTPCI